jgi:hypothetical protein
MMLRRVLWILFFVAACTPAQRRAVFAAAGPAAGTTDQNAPFVTTLTPTIIRVSPDYGESGDVVLPTDDRVCHYGVLRVSPDHGESGDVVTITGRGFGLDAKEVRVRIGGAPVEVMSLRDTGDGYQQIEVELNASTVSGPVSIYAAGQWTTFPGTFCAQPVIHGLTLAQSGDDVIVQISGSNFDPFALVYVGDTPQEPQRLKSARRPHRTEPTRLFIVVQPGDRGTVWVENRCPDGRNYAVTSTTTFWKSTTY